jgi:hypothetical protein
MGTGDGRWERHGRGDEQSRGGDRTRNKNMVENLGWTEAVDMTAVQCVVGQVKVSGQWAILDCSGSMAQAYYDPDEEDHDDGQQAQDRDEND